MRIKGYLLLLIVTFYNCTLASSFSYDTKVNDKAEYSINLKFSFEGVELSEILPNYLFSNELQTNIDQRTRRFHVESRNQRVFTQLNKRSTFKTIIDATQYGKDVEITYQCNLINFSNRFSLNCKYDGLDDGIPFISVDPIKYSSYTMNCYEVKNTQSVKCIFSMIGKTKDFDYVFIKRTADRLAISGLSVVVSNYYKAFLALESADLDGYKSYRKDSFFQNQVVNIRPNYFKYMRNDRLQKSVHSERGSN